MLLVRFIHPSNGLPLAGTMQGSSVFAGDETFSVDALELLAPCIPTKIVCVGRNYADHAKELGNKVPDKPLLFLKPPSAVIGPEEAIVLPDSERVQYEAELAVVIGKRCKNVAASEAGDVTLGYTCMNDVSDRVAQQWETNWVRAKAFDTSAPLGPAILPYREAVEPFHITLRVNGELRQDGTTSDLFFSIPVLIETISAIMTLEPGDVIATGTPAGVGELHSGDRVEVEIEGIGILRNSVE
ncbi:fumarylacetoacetate hydrolase family protein [Candidatus Bipolaricaulota bacterium]|nr:fumarylacetoacetate hydrolase family protein [Candidatus Bipolaricaulota bacterium]